ncbi:MAG: hypothetical protein ABIE55_02515 [Candidatus Aenigmatarchaeota archaeon]
MYNAKIAEDFSILMIGSIERPVPSDLHIQKEMFVLTQTIPDLREIFNFKKHYQGPFSQILRDIIDSPIYVDRAFERRGRSILLSKNGKKEFNNIVKRNIKEEDFNILNINIKLIRNIYDRLNRFELLFLVYDTYPKYIEMSDVYNSIIKNKKLVNEIIVNLIRKGSITEDRFMEIKKRYNL